MWNDFTDTIAVAIDNCRQEYELTINRAKYYSRLVPEHFDIVGDQVQAARISLATWLKKRHIELLNKVVWKDSSLFQRSLAGMLLAQCIEKIEWRQLAEHYLQKVEEENNE